MPKALKITKLKVISFAYQNLDLDQIGELVIPIENRNKILNDQ